MLFAMMDLQLGFISERPRTTMPPQETGFSIYRVRCNISKIAYLSDVQRAAPASCLTPADEKT
jgi:hypothetical protein